MISGAMTDDEIRQLYTDGLSVREISRLANRSHQTIVRRLLQRDVKLRPPPGASPEVRAKAVALYLEGELSCGAVASRFAVSSRQIHRWVKAAGHNHPRMPAQGFTLAKRAAVVGEYLRDQKASCASVGRKHGIGDGAVRAWVNAAGYAIRKRPAWVWRKINAQRARAAFRRKEIAA